MLLTLKINKYMVRGYLLFTSVYLTRTKPNMISTKVKTMKKFWANLKEYPTEIIKYETREMLLTKKEIKSCDTRKFSHMFKE